MTEPEYFQTEAQTLAELERIEALLATRLELTGDIRHQLIALDRGEELEEDELVRDWQQLLASYFDGAYLKIEDGVVVSELTPESVIKVTRELVSVEEVVRGIKNRISELEYEARRELHEHKTRMSDINGDNLKNSKDLQNQLRIKERLEMDLARIVGRLVEMGK